MNEEYLWDKSGEPDPEIQQLEEILGTLRYQPKPLVLPTEQPRLNGRRYIPIIAIAATLLFAALAGLAWLRMSKHSAPLPENQTAEAPGKVVTPKNASIEEKKKEETVAVKNEPPRRREYKPGIRRTTQAPVHDKEALEARDQLMIALRLASEKLGTAQRKVHGPATPNQIRNQHKVG